MCVENEVARVNHRASHSQIYVNVWVSLRLYFVFYEPPYTSKTAFAFWFVIDQNIPPKLQLLAVFKFHVHYWLLVPERYHRNPLITILTALNYKSSVGLRAIGWLTDKSRFADSNRLIKLTFYEFSQLAWIKMKSTPSSLLKHLPVEKVSVVRHFSDHIANLLIFYGTFKTCHRCCG